MKLSRWLAEFVVISSILFVGTNGDFPSGAHQAVRCMLAHTAPQDCSLVPKVKVPGHLLQEFDAGPNFLHDVLQNTTLIQLSDDQISNIPLSLLYLIPRSRFADLKINQLRAILQKHGDDTSLVHQVVSCLQHQSKLSKFIEKLNFTLPEESLQILAESVQISDLTEDFFKSPFLENEPLLAYLRPAVLFNVESTTWYTIYFLIQKTESKWSRKSVFYFLTEAATRHRAPLSKLQGFVLGLTPDQLSNESLSFQNPEFNFKLDLSILQARALFERTYQSTSLGTTNFIDSKPLLYKLSPELLQRFPENVQKYDVNYIESSPTIPLPTACQITEYVKADCIRTSKLKDENKFWSTQIRHLGKWVYTLPLSALEDYKTSVLSTAILKTLESPDISPLQAYYLSGRGEAFDVMAPNSVLALETFLQALPASQLVKRKLGDISLNVMLHLVSKLPANNLVRTLSLVNKIASSIGDGVDIASNDDVGEVSILEELLGNKDVNQIMALLSPKDLALSTEAVLKFFAENRIRNSFSQIIQQLPHQILADLLDYLRLEMHDRWRWSKLLQSSEVSHLLIGGLTCQHIEDMDTGIFIHIMSHYNAIRKKRFPKNLQHCCLKKLISYLNLKMSLTQTDPDLGLISILEPIEIESIGGYVLLNIPLEAMEVSPYLGHILSKIGQLSSTELMLSTDVSRLELIANLAVNKENNNVNTFMIRNLVWYLPPNANTPDLRLALEAGLLDTTVCLPSTARQRVASRLISAFGSPNTWSAGVLANLQDLLIVFSDVELAQVSQSTWTKAADSLTSRYDDLVDWIEPSSFYEVCANLLGGTEKDDYKNAVSHYIRWRLNAAQWLLNTVVPIPQPDDQKSSYTYSHDNLLNQDEEFKNTLSVFDQEVEMETFTKSEDIESNEETKVDPPISIEERTTEEITTEEITTEEITSEEITTEEITTEEITTEEITPEEITTEEITTEKITTKDSKMEVSTTEEITTEEIATEQISTKDIKMDEVSTTEEITTEEINTEKVTTKESTTEKITTKEKTTEASKTEKSTVKKPTTEEVTLEKNSTKKNENQEIITEGSTSTFIDNNLEENTVNNSITDNKSISNKSITDNSLTHQNLTVDFITQSNDQDPLTKKMFRATTETSKPEKNERTEVLVLNSSTPVTTTSNSTSSHIMNNDISKANNISVNVNVASNENTTVYNLPPCINSVDKDDCQNYTSPIPIKTNNMSTINIPHSSNDTANHVFPKQAYSIFNKTNNLSAENQSNYSVSQNTPTASSKILNNELDSPTSEYNNSFSKNKTSNVTFPKTDDQHSKITETSSSLHKPNKQLPPESNINSTLSSYTASFQYNVKNTTYDGHFKNNQTSNTTSKIRLLPEDNSNEESEEDELTYDATEDDFGILEKPDRSKRSITTQDRSIKLSCKAVKMVGRLAELTLTTLDLKEMSTDDVADCRAEFGNMKLSEMIQKTIWNRIEENLKLDGIHLLGRLLQVVSVADLWDVSFDVSKPWTLETINAIIRHNNNTMVLKKLMQGVERRNAEYSVDLLTALGPAVCSLETDRLRALSVVGLELGPSCPSCLPYLAGRAIEELGAVTSWTLHFVHSLQTIVAGLDLDNWKKLAASYHKPLSGLMPSAAKCLNTSHLEVLSPEQIGSIPAITLLSLSEHQLQSLKSTQLEAVKNITHPSVLQKLTPTKQIHIAGFPTGNSFHVLPTTYLIICISIFHIFASI